MAASNQGKGWTQTLFTRGYGKNVRGGPQFMTAWNDLIKPRKNTDYHAQYLYRQLQNLNADMFPSNSRPAHGNPNMRTLRLDGGEVDYLVGEDGSVVLLNWRGDEMHRYRRMGGEAAGLYRAEREALRWSVSETPVAAIDTELAAVNVSGNGVDDVAKDMARVLSQGYPSFASKLSKLRAQYTLFHVSRSIGDRMYEMSEVVKDVRKLGRQPNDRLASRGGVESARAVAGGTASKAEHRQAARATEAARQLAAAIEVAGRKGRKIKWAAEGQGVALFASALHLLIQQERLRDGKAFNVNQRQSLYVVRPGRTRSPA